MLATSARKAPLTRKLAIGAKAAAVETALPPTEPPEQVDVSYGDYYFKAKGRLVKNQTTRAHLTGHGMGPGVIEGVRKASKIRARPGEQLDEIEFTVMRSKESFQPYIEVNRIDPWESQEVIPLCMLE